MIFGRSSRRKSHWLYRSAVTKTKKFNDEKAEVIVEIRGDGAQTVFPGSVHASGEQITFDADGEPATAEYEQLEFTCIQLCIATVLLRHWHDGSRHELALAAAGFLAKSRWKEDDVAKLIVAVAKAAADGETDDRRHCVVDTYQRLASGEPIQGYAKLCELLGEKIADKLASWCRSAVEAAARSLVHQVNTTHASPPQSSNQAAFFLCVPKTSSGEVLGHRQFNLMKQSRNLFCTEPLLRHDWLRSKPFSHNDWSKKPGQVRRRADALTSSRDRENVPVPAKCR
jgi:hypothetical protein